MYDCIQSVSKAKKRTFNAERTNKMTYDEYMQFFYCRMTNFLSGGIPTFAEFLDLSDNTHSRKDFEIFSYCLLDIIRQIVEKASLSFSKQIELIPLKRPIPLEVYKAIAPQIKADLKVKVSNYENGCRLFTKFRKE